MAKATTMAQERVRSVAEQALALGELTLAFYATKCGGLDAAKAKAKSFQSSFASMRARSRRRMPQMLNIAIDPKSPYDDLVCSCFPMDNGEGWNIHMSKSIVSDDWVILDKNGDVINSDAWIDSELMAVITKPREFDNDPERLRRLLQAVPALRDDLPRLKLADPDAVTTLDDLEAGYNPKRAEEAMHVAPKVADLAQLGDEDIFGEE